MNFKKRITMGVALGSLMLGVPALSLAQSDAVNLNSYRIETNDCPGCGFVDIQSQQDLENHLNEMRSIFADGAGPYLNFQNGNNPTVADIPQVIYLDFDAGGDPVFPVCNADGTVFGIFNDVSLILAASIGSFLVLFVVMLIANRVKDTMALLIIGLMFGSVTSAIVSVFAYFSDAEQLQRFIFWSYGSVGNLSWNQLILLASFVLFGVLISIFSIKNLNAFLLGENYAQSLGVSLKKSRILIISATGLLAGSITAFAGPIAFVGLAVPHLTRQLFNTTEHKVLVPAVFIYGAILMLVCDTIAQLPNSANVLPINAITSLIGAPVVIWLLVRKRKLFF